MRIYGEPRFFRRYGVQFAEFLQHTSLKRLGILYLTTCVGFGYGLYGGAISWNHFEATSNPLRTVQHTCHPSHTTRPTNINVVPIDYPLRARLRGRLTLRGLALRRNPWSFGDRASHPVYRYSCLHSHFRYLHDPLPHDRPSQAYGTLRYRVDKVHTHKLR